MINTYYTKFNEYIQKCPLNNGIDWFDLPETCYLKINKSNNNNQEVKIVRKLIDKYGEDKGLNNSIKGIQISQKKGILKISFPIKFDTIEYVRLYSLMISEGSFRTEFSLNVPEGFFHDILEKNLRKLISNEISISIDYNKNHKRSRAPAITRHLIKIPNHLPKILFKNKEYAREYLIIAFEAEGCPIYNLKRYKKYIKLTRNNSVTQYFYKHNLKVGKRVFINHIKNNYPTEYYKMKNNPDELILGEHLLLKYWFDIESNLKLEHIRLNKIGNRKGKISSKWVLSIYSGEDIRKFRDEIGFISENKNRICDEMLEKIPSRKKQYTALKIMKRIQKDGVFLRSDFANEMKNLGYVSPQKFLWDYCNNKKFIERVSRGVYRLLVD